MAKVQAPLFGFAASGSIAKTITYAKWKGIMYARQYVVPSNPRTAAQIEHRNKFRELVDHWHDDPCDITIRTALNLKAAERGLAMSGFNYYMRRYLLWSYATWFFAQTVRYTRTIIPDVSITPHIYLKNSVPSATHQIRIGGVGAYNVWNSDVDSDVSGDIDQDLDLIPYSSANLGTSTRLRFVCSVGAYNIELGTSISIDS